jgi:hypothetical protein
VWTTDELRNWSLPASVLHQEELPRLADFLELFREQLAVVAGSVRTPTVTQRVTARRRAVIIWEMDRATSDIKTAAVRRRAEESSAGRRQELFADSQLRQSQVSLAIEEIDSWDRFSRVAAGLPEYHIASERGTG